MRLWTSRPRSVRARTALAAGLVAAALFGAMAGVMRHVAYDQQMSQARSDAREQAQLLLSDTTRSSWPDGDDWGKFPYELVSSGGLMSASSQLKAFETGGRPFMSLPASAGDVPYDGSATAVFPRTGRSTLAGTTVSAITATLSVGNLYTVTGPGTDEATSIPGGNAPGATVRAYVFVTTGAAHAAVAALDRVLYPAVPAGVLLVMAVAYVAARRALRPVDQITARTSAVTATDPRERVAVPATGDEIARLATAINTTLGRLEAASRIQRRFVADAAHELRSPLASLLATLEVAQTYPQLANWPETVAIAVRQARRLQALADDLLLLARLDAEPDVPATRAARAAPGRCVELSDLVRDVAADFATRPGEVSVHDDTGGRALVVGMYPQLERMLRNLVDNAVRYAHSKVSISVSVDGDDVMLTVEDDGPGIPPKDRERVFERFTRLEDDRSRDTGGTGLGLAIAREIAERHDGTLHALDSTTGARLRAHLPLAAASRPESGAVPYPSAISEV